MEISHLHFSYNGKTEHLKGINETIEHGKITTIIGPNGCGKSTLLSVLCRTHAPTSGQIILNGKEIAQYKPKELATQLAVVHQQNEAPIDMTVEKLVGFGRIPHKKFMTASSDEDREAVEWALTCCNLLQKRDKRIADLSGGERQRVWIGMALAQKTPILFLDEPTTYLDMYYQIELLELIQSLNRQQKLTIVMVLHDINQAVRYSDLIIAMKDGKIISRGRPEIVVDEQMIRTIYGVNAVVKGDDDTGTYIVPLGI